MGLAYRALARPSMLAGLLAVMVGLPPSAMRPRQTNMTLDAVALACVEVEGRRILQLHLYPRDGEPLLPEKATLDRLKAFPGAVIAIDGRTFEAGVFFSERYAIVADVADGYPQLSDQVVAAMRAGKTMVLRFDLIDEAPGQPVRHDGEAVIDLAADAIVSRCLGEPVA